MLQTLQRELAARRPIVQQSGDLRGLAGRLRGHLALLTDREIYFPDEKALLSRDGGVCPHDGSRLAFDPSRPFGHRCRRCGKEVEGVRHHRAWITRYQIWLSERAIHLALLGVLTEDRALLERAGRVIFGYAERYRAYPNRDNVLGPTRLFFSTYLESIWLLQVATAAALLRAAEVDVLTAREWRSVDAMVRESAELVAEFDEGGSNRQVWNNAAVLAAGTWLGHDNLTAHALRGRSGLTALLGGVTTDGMWYEGENYHLFALRGFLLAAEWMRWRGLDLYEDGRLGAMYGAPLATLLPDLTLPARGDSPYGVSIRQQRFAELWEHGRARTADARLDGILHRLYAADAREGDDHGLAELAEQEENRPPQRLSRDRLGWKALLWMLPSPPPAVEWETAGAELEASGLVVLRPATGSYASVECRRRGGGHGHPDVLHLSLVFERPLLSDFGTASYVSSSLHWYRSTLAHNAPGVAGHGQVARGTCEAFDAGGGWQWCRAAANGIAGPRSVVRRTVVASADMVLDIVDVEVPDHVVIDLPIHPVGVMAMSGLGAPMALDETTGGGHETGYDVLEHIRAPSAPYARIPIRQDERDAGSVQLAPRDRETVLSAEAPGPPAADFADGVPTRFLIRRAAGPGRWVALYAGGGVSAEIARVANDAVTVTRDGRQVEFALSPVGVKITEGDYHVELAGAYPASAATPAERESPPSASHILPMLDAAPSHEALMARGLSFKLDHRHYRRSEEPYPGAGRFSARCAVALWEDAVVFGVDVRKPDVVVRPGGASDPALDNEHPDIHSDGVQCYVGRDSWSGFLVVPEPDRKTIRASAVAGTAADVARVEGTSERTEVGYRMLVVCQTDAPFAAGDSVRFNVVVNEMQRGRMRRAGQLALTGGGWVYLRGDREPEGGALLGVAV